MDKYMSNISLKIGVLSMSMLSMSALVITSAFGSMIKYFSDVAPSTIQMLGSLPSLGALLVTLIVGWLATRVSKKKLVLFGIICVAVGGLIPTMYFSNINILLGCSFLLGIGIGFITTVNPMLLTVYFNNTEERASVMGINTAINALGAMILMMLGGVLGESNWAHTYYVYFIAFLIFLVVLFLVPGDTIKSELAQMPHHKTSIRGALSNINKYIYIIALLTFCISALYTIYLSNISILLSDKHIGGTAFTGIINGIGTLGGLATGFGIKSVRRYVSKNALCVGFLLMFISFTLVLLSSHLSLILIGSVFSGVAMCLIMSTAPYEISMLAEPHQIAPAMSIYIFASSCGSIVSPILLRLCNIHVGYESFIIGGILTLMVTLALFITNFGARLQIHPELNQENV